MKVVACIPVYGRGRLLARTIYRLYEKNKVFKVICAGDQLRDKRVALKHGAEWVDAPNDYLGYKWNEAFAAAEKHSPDACLFMGSSDWIEDNWMVVMKRYVKHYDLIGVPDFYMADYSVHPVTRELIRIRAAYSSGYSQQSSRYGDSVGGGRVLTKSLLNQVGWRPFQDDITHSLDWSMTTKASAVDAKIHTLPHLTLRVLSLSTNLWANKHSFSREITTGVCTEYGREEADRFLSRHFPEALTLFDDTWNSSTLR